MSLLLLFGTDYVVPDVEVGEVLRTVHQNKNPILAHSSTLLITLHHFINHAHSMELYLIRHGETVDNVAGIYAGVRDSALTNHGIDQARRLGGYFAKSNVKLTHIFSSPLSRAFKTAEAVHKAQSGLVGHKTKTNAKSLDIVKVPDLIEQDFGYYEGKPFYARTDPKKTGREAHHDRHKNDPGFVDVEAKESMAKRADDFLDQHLMPLFDASGEACCVAVVSHGILLSNLWRRLLLRLPRKSLTIDSEVIAARDNIVLEHLGGWSNTGYLKLSMSRDSAVTLPSSPLIPSSQPAITKVALLETLPTTLQKAVPLQNANLSEAYKASELPKAVSRVLQGWSTRVVAINSKQHLVGLKRQRGGIGRLAHDEGQKKLDTFFKRQRTG